MLVDNMIRQRKNVTVTYLPVPAAAPTWWPDVFVVVLGAPARLLTIIHEI